MIPIPLNDHIRRHSFWFITFALIAANVVAFMFELSLGRDLDRLIYVFGIIPARYTTPRGLATLSAQSFFVPVFGSMFRHGGWLHLLGNMLFLFVFGRSVEDRFGHIKFTLIYFLGGIESAQHRGQRRHRGHSGGVRCEFPWRSHHDHPSLVLFFLDGGGPGTFAPGLLVLDPVLHRVRHAGYPIRDRRRSSLVGSRRRVPGRVIPGVHPASPEAPAAGCGSCPSVMYPEHT